MSATVTFVRLAAGIASISFSHSKQVVVLEWLTGGVSQIDRKHWSAAALSRKPLTPKSCGFVVEPHGPYTSFYLDSFTSLVAATREGGVDLFALDGQRVNTIALKVKSMSGAGQQSATAPKAANRPPISGAWDQPGICKAIPNANNSAILSVNYRPAKLDTETYLSLHYPQKEVFKDSALVRSDECAVSAVWNNMLNSCIIHERTKNQLFLWRAGEEEVKAVNPPQASDKLEWRYHLDQLGRYIYAYAVNEQEKSQALYVGAIEAQNVTWKELVPARKVQYLAIAVHPTQEKIAVQVRDAQGIGLVTLDFKGQEIGREAVVEGYADAEMGWISDTELVAGGDKGLMAVDYAAHEHGKRPPLGQGPKRLK